MRPKLSMIAYSVSPQQPQHRPTATGEGTRLRAPRWKAGGGRASG